MKKIALVNIMMLVFFGHIACSQQDASTDSAANKVVARSSVEHYQSAGRYVRLMEQGIKLKESRQYTEALTCFRNAYANEAFGKIELTMALKQMADTYELMNEFDLAADLYEAASKEALHPLNAEKYHAQADRLRQINRTPSVREELEAETETGRPPQ